MNRNLPIKFAGASLIALSSTAFACTENAVVRPLGSDHLLYTIERAAEDGAPSLQGLKFRLIVNESGAENLLISPGGAFTVTKLTTFDGNVTFNAEIVDAPALYKAESWGRLPRPLTFQVSCQPGEPTAQTAGSQQPAQPAPPPATNPPPRMITLTPSQLRTELAETSGSTVVEAYKQTELQTAPLPPVPQAPAVVKPQMKSAPAGSQKPSRPTTPRVATRIGQPAGPLSEQEMTRIELRIESLREEPADKGTTKLSYELVLRNPLSRNIECDVELESFYPKSFSGSEVVAIDTSSHEKIQIRSNGFRTGVMGEIKHMPNVLGGTRWMKQNRFEPEKGGLRLRNCLTLGG